MALCSIILREHDIKFVYAMLSLSAAKLIMVEITKTLKYYRIADVPNYIYIPHSGSAKLYSEVMGHCS